MADLTGVNDTLPTRIGGVSSTSGLPDNYADVNVGGSLQVAGQGVAGTPAGGVVSIQGVTGGTAVPASQSGVWNITNITGTITLPTGAATSANQTTEITSLQLIDNPVGSVGAGTAGTSSFLIGGQYNSTLPTLTNTQQSAVQLDSSGRLITNVGSTAPPNNIIATGTLTGTGQTVNLTLQGTASVNIDVSGSGFVGNLVVIENTPSQSRVLGVFNGNSSPISASITANGNYRVVGLSTSSTLTVQFSAYTSGSATINIYGSTAPFIVMPYSANAANLLGTSYLNDGVGNPITSASNGSVTPSQLLGVQTPDTASATTALAALNATIAVSMAGLTSVGFQLLAGTFIGTIVPQCSLDGGTTWQTCSFYNNTSSSITTSLTFAAANTLTVLSILPIGGASNVRVLVSAYTSGTANGLLRASQVTAAAGAVTAAAFGTVNNTYVTLTNNTTTQLLAANTNRKYAYISNNSGGLIAIQFGSATGLTSAARGLVIPNGNFYELKGDNLYTGPVYAYTNSSGLVVAVTEGTP